MSRRPASNSTSVALFPFLAVLVCTMGSLILLLIITTKRIRAAAVEKARLASISEPPRFEPPQELPVEPAPNPPQPVDDREPAPDEETLIVWRTRIEELTAERNSVRQQLAATERKLSVAQAAILRSKDQSAAKKDQIQQARDTQQNAERDQQRLKQEVAALRNNLAQSEQRLQQAEEEKQTAHSKFAFVAFDGRTGTTRRPILIECTDKFMRFVPEDVKLAPADLNGFTTGFNPLLIASRELVHYWTAHDMVQAEEDATAASTGKSETDLLSLSSQGKEPYVLLLVRPSGAMTFLIAKGLLAQLKIPHGYELLDDGMELELVHSDPNAKAVCQNAITQTLNEREKMQQLMSRNRDQQRDQLQLEPNSPTFTVIDPPANDSKPGFVTRPQRGVEGNSSTRTNPLSPPSANAGSGGTGSAPNFGSGSATSPNHGGQAFQSSRASANGLAASPRTAAPNENGERVGVSSPINPPQNHGADTTSLASTGLSRVGSGQGGVGKNGTGKSSSGQSGTSEKNGTGEKGEPSEEPLPQSPLRRFADDGSKPFPLGRMDRAKGSADSSSDRVSQTNSQRTNSQSRSDATARRANAPTASQSAASQAAASNQRSSSSSSSQHLKRRYSMPRSGIGLEKEIAIRVWSNRVVIEGQFEVPIDAAVRTESLVDRVLVAMDRVQSDWPSAGDGYHWVPTLHYEVVPGGEQVQQRLNSALFDLGLVATVDFLKADPDAPTKPTASREASRSRAAAGGAR